MTMNDMKVVFLDIDGVIQPLGKQDRFKHLDEIEEIAKALDQKIPGFNYYEYVSEENYPRKFLRCIQQEMQSLRSPF